MKPKYLKRLEKRYIEERHKLFDDAVIEFKKENLKMKRKTNFLMSLPAVNLYCAMYEGKRLYEISRSNYDYNSHLIKIFNKHGLMTLKKPKGWNIFHFTEKGTKLYEHLTIIKKYSNIT